MHLVKNITKLIENQDSRKLKNVDIKLKIPCLHKLA